MNGEEGVVEQIEEAGKEAVNFLEGVGNSIWNAIGGGGDEEVEDESPERERKA